MSSSHLSGTSFVLGTLLVSAAAVLHAQVRPASPAPRQTTPGTGTTTKVAQSHDNDDGDIIFAQNCSRCHQAPDAISPRIAGTVVRHMRVRAQLNQTDAEAVLRFLNP